MQGLKKRIVAAVAVVLIGLTAWAGTAAQAAPGRPDTISTVSSGYILAFSGKCLDAMNAFGRAVPPSGYYVQTWSCGVLGGEDQNFILTTNGTVDYLEYVAPGGPYCVRQNSGLMFIDNVTPTNGTCPDVWALSGNEYQINPSTDGFVLNVKAAGTGNGVPIILWPNTGQFNEQFSRPFQG